MLKLIVSVVTQGRCNSSICLTSMNDGFPGKEHAMTSLILAHAWTKLSGTTIIGVTTTSTQEQPKP